MNRFLNGISRFCFSPEEGDAAPAGGGVDPGAAAGAQSAAASQGNQSSAQTNQGDGNKTGAEGNQSGAAKPTGTGAEPAGTKTADLNKVPQVGDGEDPKPKEGEAPKGPAWSEKWREDLAGEDQTKLNILKRYTDPKAVVDALVALQKKVSSGELKGPLPKDATPEQVADYRKAMGVPEKPEQYIEKLPEGLVFGESDSKVVNDFVQEMHKMNAPQEIVQQALSSYAKALEAQTLARQELDVSQRQAAEDQLRADWGPDFRPNINNMKAFLQNNFPASVQESLINARLGDENGTPLFCHPDVIKAFAQIGRMMNPTGTVNAGAGMDSVDTINSQIAEYEKQMRTNREAWFKDEKARSHHRELLAARERLTATK